MVVPAYNAEAHIGEVLVGVRRALPHAQVIVVDDGSTDATAAIVSRRHARLCSHVQNLGKGAALRTGFRVALEQAARVVITLDADGQHNPSDTVKLLAAFERNPSLDIIVGTRSRRLAEMPIHRIISNAWTSALISWRTGVRLRDSQSGFRLIRAEVLRCIQLETLHFETESELLIKAALQGSRIGEVPIQTVYHTGGHSHMRIADVWRFIRLYLASFSWPTASVGAPMERLRSPSL